MKSKSVKFILLGYVCCLLFSGCASTPRNTVTQFCTIDALLAGAYEGELKCSDLGRHGNLGIGTFDKLDGEMLVLDGHVYQVRSDGKAYSVDPALTTPFASVINFVPEKTVAIPQNLDYAGIQKFIDAQLPHTNVIVAFKITGTFAEIKTRSVPAQVKPYRPLVEVTSTQPTFKLNNVSGTLIGFRMPDFVKGINVPGFHAHFLTTERTAGGHVLTCAIESGKLELATSTKMVLLLPKDPARLGRIDFSRDRSAELEKVEK